jgi:hypothetical protein
MVISKGEETIGHGDQEKRIDNRLAKGTMENNETKGKGTMNKETGLQNAETIFGTQQIKGIVSRDWEGLQMGSLDRSEFPKIPLEVYF